MRSAKGDTERVNPKAIDLISTVKKLHSLSSQDLSKLIRDIENNSLKFTTENGSSLQIDVENLAKIPLHLIAKLVQSYLNEDVLRHMLSGITLLHTLYDIAPRHPKLEQILVDDISLAGQLFDLIFFMLVVLNNYTQERQPSAPTILLHSTIVACSLLLLTGFVSPQWPELANVLVHHPRVDRFMDVAFAAVRIDIELLRIKLVGSCNGSCENLIPTIEEPVKHLCQQCEVSLQFLQMLCQQKMFRDRLVKHKELCGKGGILLLARLILDLHIPKSLPESNYVAGAVSRMKSKVLSILLHLCEAESISYLDEVANTPGSLCLAKSVALEILELLKTLFSGYHKEKSSRGEKIFPKGFLQLNAMRLADIFSDDSNFRSYITIHITEVLTTLFSRPHGEFVSNWCASDLLVWEEDATLEYDPFVAAGWVLSLLSSSNSFVMTSSEYTFITCNMPRASYAHQRTSLLVKVIANLHCFVPDICKEEKDIFLNKFFQCLQKEFPNLSYENFSNTAAEKAASIIRNLCSLLSHAESLIPSFLNQEDVHLLRVFIDQLEPLMSSHDFRMDHVQESKDERSISGDKLAKLDINEHHQEAQSAGGYSTPLSRKDSPDQTHRSNDLEVIWKNSSFQEVDQFNGRGKAIDPADDDMREYRARDTGKPSKVAARGSRDIDRDAQNVETSGSDSSSARGKNNIDQLNNVQGEEKADTLQFSEKQRRKRKRTIMNDRQTSLIEKALLDKPDMQRDAVSLQSWADRLSEHGSEVTASQLKNWLNNRKARLARAAKDVRIISEGDDSQIDKQGGSGIRPFNELSGSPVEDDNVSVAPQGRQDEIGGNMSRTGCNDNSGRVVAESVNSAAAEGQYVMLVDRQGEEIGQGKVYQVHGKWSGRNLEESGTCVVDIIDFKRERWARLPHPCEATGTSFDQAEKKLGVMRVLWDTNKLFMLQTR